MADGYCVGAPWRRRATRSGWADLLGAIFLLMSAECGAPSGGWVAGAAGNTASGDSGPGPTGTTPFGGSLNTGGSPSGALTPSGAASPSASGLPCDIEQLLAARCTSCHSSPPTGGAPMPLVTRSDLTSVDSIDSSRNVAQACLDRMQSATSPMPPRPATPASAAEIAALQSWIAAGMPDGNCDPADAALGGAGTVTNPYATPVVCTSGSNWSGGNEGASSMNPGQACISCHSSNREAPRFAIAGTIYPTAHEPNNCNGTSANSITIVLTDAQGRSTTLRPNAAGNFYLKGNSTTLSLPYQAKVVSGSQERHMSTPQSSGDCNSCHTEAGTNDAPGRIMVP